MALLVSGLAACFYAVVVLSARDYLGCGLLVLTGTSVLRGAIELLRPATERS